MSEERAEYTVHPDVAIRLQVSEAHIKHLTSTIDGMTMVMGRHADTITAQRERIAELEAQVQRLEAEAQQRFDYTPVTLLRYIVNSHPTLPVDDRIAASRWLDTVRVVK